MFTVVWYGTPHSPFKALDADKAAFANLNEASANHYGELVAMDRGIARDTLLVFCSDNGGLPNITPETVGGLRLLARDVTMDASFAGKDYPGGIVSPPDPEPVFWYETPQYQPFFEEWKERWEYKSHIERALGTGEAGREDEGGRCRRSILSW